MHICRDWDGRQRLVYCGRAFPVSKHGYRVSGAVPGILRIGTEVIVGFLMDNPLGFLIRGQLAESPLGGYFRAAAISVNVPVHLHAVHLDALLSGPSVR